MSGAVLAQLGGSPTFAATASPADLSGIGSDYTTAQTVQVASVTTVGGVLPLSYAWTYVSGDTDIYARNPGNQFTRFAAFVTPGADFTAVYKCVVTDALATVVDSNTITINIQAL